jgi:hypothetical protein
MTGIEFAKEGGEAVIGELDEDAIEALSFNGD